MHRIYNMNINAWRTTMKKRNIFRVAFLLIASLVALAPLLASCGNTDGNTSTSNDQSSDISAEESTKPMKEPGFFIAKNGELCVDIVIGEDATEKEQAAAADLAGYIYKIVGKKPSVVTDNKMTDDFKHILVGRSSLTDAAGVEKPTGFPGGERVIVRNTADSLIVFGNDDGPYNGTQYAVNMLLEYIGCGWYCNGELWEVVPSLETIDLTDIDIDHKPHYTSRITRAYESKYDVSSRWYLGGEGSLTGHWLYQIAPADMYSEHPDWYAYTDGSRNPAPHDYFQFCYSNDEFASYVSQKLIEFFDKNPNTVSMTIAANDGWDEHYCECERCTSLGNVSDVYVSFANKVAKQVAEKYPERSLQIYMYHMMYTPPTNNVALEPNVELMLCREASLTRALDTDYFKKGKDTITRNRYDCSWRENARRWIEKTSCKNVSVWEWNCISAGRAEWQYVPWVKGNVASRDQAVYDELGVKYVFYDQGPAKSYLEDDTSFELRWPLWYVAAKLSWDNSKTGEELLRDACDKLFGKAAGLMFDYYKKLADASEYCEEYSMTWVPPYVNQVYNSYADPLYTYTHYINEIAKAIEEIKPECTATEQQRIDNQLAYWYKTVAEHLS